MQLRLNPSHPLCSPSRNLVFATFGTGYGAHVLDLSDSPSHGIMSHGGTVPTIHRTLQSDRPSGFPSDFQALNMSASATAAVSFGNPSKVTGLTSNFSAAMWFRPYGPNTNYSAGMRATSDEFSSGWMTFTNFGALGGYTNYAWSMRANNGGGYYGTQQLVTNTALDANKWALMSFSWTNNAVTMYTNGVATTVTMMDADYGTIGSITNPVSGNTFAIGSFQSTPQRGDSGPVMVWGSALSASDHALLYRDTWGMVSRSTVPNRAIASGIASSSVATSRPRLSIGTKVGL